jgi:hypothetical protein
MRTILAATRAIVLATAAASALSCAGAIGPTETPSHAMTPISAWWVQPTNLAARDLFFGRWGATHAPDPRAEYTFVRPKAGGFNPGLVVRDPQGREWHIKQPSEHHGDEGPVEVVLSHVLSALGYHQPPVYYLASFRLRDDSGVHVVPGGRFRLDVPSLKARGEWSWQQNPFVGQRPYQGLLVILLLFNSSDLKNSNNTLYDYDDGSGGKPKQWYVVRDIGLALGKTGRIAPQRNNLDVFARTRFITGVSGGFVVFGDYHGLHAELLRNRITREDVQWAAALIGGLTDRQWQDAFRGGGYDPAVAARFIAILRGRIAEARRVGGSVTTD